MFGQYTFNRIEVLMRMQMSLLFSLLLVTALWADRDNEFIVRLKPGVSPEILLSQTRTVGMRPVKQLSRRMNIWLFEKTESSSSPRAVMSAAAEVDGIETIQKNHKVQLRSETKTPNDTKFGDQWFYHNTGQSGGTADADIDAAEAWALSTGGTTVDGQEVVIAIVDDGADLQHEDLSFWKNKNEIPNNNIDDDNNGYVDDYDGWDAFSSNGKVSSGNHGTHVSGIAAAIGNNGKGVTGVNWGAKVLPIVGSSSSESVVIEAYGYALELRATYNETNGAKGAFVVVTNSSFGVDYGDPADYPIWSAMYDSLGKHGIISCAATANQNLDVEVSGDMPTKCTSDYLISVTNSTHTDSKYTSAAYGSVSIDLAAPGTSITSTLPGSSYGELTGTSMSTPVVAGAVALLVSGADQKWLDAYKDDPATGALELRKAILDGVDKLPAFAGITTTGGRLNVHNSMNLLRQTSVLNNQSKVALKATPYAVKSDAAGFQLTMESALPGEALFTLVSLRGQELDRVATKNLRQGAILTLGTQKLATGYYVLHAVTTQGEFKQKILFR